MQLNLKIRILLILMLNASCLKGAIGCQSILHSPSFWSVVDPVYVRCDCPCRHISGPKGQCLDCGHYGDPNRGEVTRRVLEQYDIAIR